MAAKMNVHEGVIGPSLVDELERFRAQDGRVSSYYLDLDPRGRSDTAAIRVALKDELAREARRIEGQDVPHDVRQALLRDGNW